MIGPREYPSAPIAGVGAVIVKGDKVLLVRRGREPLLGQWSLPGGAVELGESLEQAIVREVKEETGLAIAPVKILKVFDRIERDSAGEVRFHYVLVDFLCTQNLTMSEDELLAASDVSELRWVPVAGLRQSKEFVLSPDVLTVIEDGLRRNTGLLSTDFKWNSI